MTRRGILLPVYALILLQTVVYVALVPLAPDLKEDLSLSAVETGALLAAASFATLIVAFPIGLLTDRLGARTLTVASAVLFTVSTLGQGLAVDFWSLLVARAGFGVALGIVWTAGLAWLAESVPRARTSALGGTVTMSGVGFTVGPAFAGLLADRFGTGVPFLAAGGAAVLVTLALLLARAETPSERPVRQPLLVTLRLVGREQLVLAGFALLVLLGFVSGGINLLVPLHLRANGLSAGEIGVAFSVASGVYTVVSAGIARLGDRTANLRTAGLATLAFALSLVLLVASGSTAAAVAFVLLRAPFWGVMDTLAYPLAAAGAERADLGRGAVLGLLNLVWGVAATTGPLVAGALAQSSGDTTAYLLMIATCLAAAAWMLAARRARAPELEQATT